MAALCAATFIAGEAAPSNRHSIAGYLNVSMIPGGMLMAVALVARGRLHAVWGTAPLWRRAVEAAAAIMLTIFAVGFAVLLVRFDSLNFRSVHLEYPNERGLWTAGLCITCLSAMWLAITTANAPGPEPQLRRHFIVWGAVPILMILYWAGVAELLNHPTKYQGSPSYYRTLHPGFEPPGFAPGR